MNKVQCDKTTALYFTQLVTKGKLRLIADIEQTDKNDLVDISSYAEQFNMVADKDFKGFVKEKVSEIRDDRMSTFVIQGEDYMRRTR